MTSYEISGATFTKDTFVGGWPLFESIATLLPVVKNYVVLDMGSTDGTYEKLKEIEKTNPKIKVIQNKWSVVDAKAFADAANECITACECETVLFHQADEIWHQNLVNLMVADLEKGIKSMSFWRYQLRENLQVMKWMPHPVQRVGSKKELTMIKDGMNPQGDGFAAPICGSYDGGWFTRWGNEFTTQPTKLPTNEMILDISQVGMFRDNIVKKRSLHAPMWHESNDIEGMSPDEWIKQQYLNPNWRKQDTPFNIPYIMRGLLGRPKYELRSTVLKGLLQNDTREVVGL